MCLKGQTQMICFLFKLGNKKKHFSKETWTCSESVSNVAATPPLSFLHRWQEGAAFQPSTFWDTIATKNMLQLQIVPLKKTMHEQKACELWVVRNSTETMPTFFYFRSKMENGRDREGGNNIFLNPFKSWLFFYRFPQSGWSTSLNIPECDVWDNSTRICCE